MHLICNVIWIGLFAIVILNGGKKATSSLTVQVFFLHLLFQMRIFTFLKQRSSHQCLSLNLEFVYSSETIESIENQFFSSFFFLLILDLFCFFFSFISFHRMKICGNISFAKALSLYVFAILRLLFILFRTHQMPST